MALCEDCGADPLNITALTVIQTIECLSLKCGNCEKAS